MELNEALSFIHGTDWKGSRLGLERMRELMRRLGDVQDTLKYVHVAGTNGKGSTSTMLASILRSAGYKTGLYTSPHLVRVNERFRIDGVDVSDAAPVSYTHLDVYKRQIIVCTAGFTINRNAAVIRVLSRRCDVYKILSEPGV